jgi:hypothetical protein
MARVALDKDEQQITRDKMLEDKRNEGWDQAGGLAAMLVAHYHGDQTTALEILNTLDVNPKNVADTDIENLKLARIIHRGGTWLELPWKSTRPRKSYKSLPRVKQAS